MTASRPYSIPKSPDEALAECRALAGTQFTDAAVRVLVTVLEAGSPAGLTARVSA